MKKSIRHLLVPALCGLCLWFAAAAAHAEELTFRATQVGAIAWVDGAGGSVLDEAAGKLYEALFLDSEWRIGGAGPVGELVIRKAGRELYRAQITGFGRDEKVALLVVHGRNSGGDGITIVNGLLALELASGAAGTLPMTFTEIARNGATRSISVFAVLAPGGSGGGVRR
jgi:hypothetical protein